jgi:hypothetical protein
MTDATFELFLKGLEAAIYEGVDNLLGLTTAIDGAGLDEAQRSKVIVSLLQSIATQSGWLKSCSEAVGSQRKTIGELNEQLEALRCAGREIH